MSGLMIGPSSFSCGYCSTGPYPVTPAFVTLTALPFQKLPKSFFQKIGVSLFKNYTFRHGESVTNN